MSSRYVSKPQQPLNNLSFIKQCAIPAFSGLLEKRYDTLIRKLLFELSTWHSLAKLRRQSETLVIELEASTFRLGKLLREFKDTICADYDTRDLPSEEAARKRARNPDKAATSGKKREFNLITYKLHSLGHYPAYIRWMGTTDNFSTQNVSRMT